jgi:urease accessory protein
MGNMRRAIGVMPYGNWPEAEAAGSVTLIFDDRHKRRLRMADDTGEDFMLDLASATLLHDGDGFQLEGGGYIRVCAAAEAVADITTSSSEHAARIAWHIGNRHTPLQVLADGMLRIIDDHVLVDMVEGLGGRVKRHEAPFAPERGAYAERGHHHD